MTTMSPSATFPQVAAPEEQTEETIAAAKRRKGFLRRAFAKVADVGARAAVTNAIKITAVTTLAGAGASAFMTAATAAVAAGAGAALYSYAKDSITDWRAARKTGTAFSWWDVNRAKKARFALVCGVAGGAFGAWLADTDTFKAGLDMAKTYGGQMLAGVASFMSGNAVAATITPTPMPILDAETIAARIESAHGDVAQAATATTPSTDTITDRINAAHAAVAAVEAPAALTEALDTAPKNALGKLWETAMTSDQAQGHFMAQMLKADPSDMASVSPQFLKDRAHDVLRLTDIPWDERLALARELAEEAQARGNRQAAGFLRDLAKLETGAWQPRGLNISGADTITAPDTTPDVKAAVPETVPKAETVLPDVSEVKPAQVPVAASTVTPAVTPVEIIQDTSVKTVTLDTDPVTGDIRETITDAIPGEGLVMERITGHTPEMPAPAAAVTLPQPVAVSAAVLGPAATCHVTLAADLSAAETFCEVSKPRMVAGDHIAFVVAGNPAQQVTTALVLGSVDVDTQNFLHEKVIGDGVARLSDTVARTAVPTKQLSLVR